MFHFYWPWLALLIPLPLLILWIPSSTKKSKEVYPELRFPAIKRIKAAFPSFFAIKKPSSWLYFSLLSLFWFFLVLALMQPEKVDQFKHITNKGYDLILAVDISASMQALDFSTPSKTISRLDVTKNVVKKFVQGRQGDRVGLVTFGGSAYLHVPLTLDTLSVGQMLDDTAPGMAGSATAIGDAIGLSVRTLRERPEGSRVLVLLTDGEDNASSIPPLEAGKLAKQYGVKIYTIGIGRGGSVPFPTKFGSLGMVDVPMDEKLLKEIAEMTGGQFFLATDQRALESIYTKINTLEKTESDQTLFLMREPFYYYPLGLAMILLLILSLYQLLARRPARGS